MAAYALAAVMFIFLLWYIAQQPRTDRDWLPYQAVPATSTISGDTVAIHNVRNVTWRSTTDFDLAYYDATYDLDDLDAMWFIVEPISDWEGAAHTFFTFRFRSPQKDQYVAISVEARRTPDESYSATGGLLQRYELLYIIADERDVIHLRGAGRKHDVFLYPINASEEKIRTLFLDMVERANAVEERPEFYNTLWNSCTTNLVDHVNAITPKRVPFSLKYLAPGYSDRLAYDLGLIDTDPRYEDLRAHYNISGRIRSYDGNGDFSAWIRS